MLDFLFTWINHVVHETPKCFAKSYSMHFFLLQFQFSSWKNFLSSLLSRSMPIVKRAWDRPFGKSESFFSFVPTMSFWTGQQQSWHWHQVLEWTIIQLFSIQFYSRMMTAVVCISYRKISSKHFSSKMDIQLFNPVHMFANEFPHFYSFLLYSW